MQPATVRREPGNPQQKITLLSIPNGRRGVRATLRIMGDLVREARTNYQIRALTLSLIKHLPSKDWLGQVRAVFDFVRSRIRYVSDIEGVETIATPMELLKIKQGDCDDMAVLAAAMLQSIGHPVRFVAVGFDGQPLSHVFVETLVGADWVPLECTELSMSLGEYPEGITDVMVEHVSLKS